MAWTWKPAGLTWRQFGRCLWRQMQRDDVTGRAAQLSFFFVLALFPFLFFLTSLLGYFAGTGTELRAILLQYLSTVTPGRVSTLIRDTLNEIIAQRSGEKVSVGLLATVWTASAGMRAAMSALNAAYGVRESRPWWKKHLVAAVLTVALAVFVAAALLLLLYGSRLVLLVAEWFHLGHTFTQWGKVLQWPVVLTFVLLAFTSLYYFAPNVQSAPQRRFIPGAVLAVVLWLLISFGFRASLLFFNAYGRTYGSLGTVVVLLLWLYLTGVGILIGGEVNAIFKQAAEKRAGEARQHARKPPAEEENET